MILGLIHSATASALAPQIEWNWGKVAFSLLVFGVLSLAIWFPGSQRAERIQNAQPDRTG